MCACLKPAKKNTTKLQSIENQYITTVLNTLKSNRLKYPKKANWRRLNNMLVYTSFYAHGVQVGI